MALRPDTPETRLVPVAGRGNFAERRLMRGVGAKERALGYAWGRLDSKQRARFGNQRNYASRLQDVADAQAEQRTVQTNQQALEKGRQMAREEAGGGASVARPGMPAGPVSVSGAGQDRPDGLIKYDDNKPRQRREQPSGPEALQAAVKAGRIIMDGGSQLMPKTRALLEAVDNGRIKMSGDPSPEHAKRTKEEQAGLYRTARLRGQFNTAAGGRIY